MNHLTRRLPFTLGLLLALAAGLVFAPPAAAQRDNRDTAIGVAVKRLDDRIDWLQTLREKITVALRTAEDRDRRGLQSAAREADRLLAEMRASREALRTLSRQRFMLAMAVIAGLERSEAVEAARDRATQAALDAGQTAEEAERAGRLAVNEQLDRLQRRAGREWLALNRTIDLALARVRTLDSSRTGLARRAVLRDIVKEIYRERQPKQGALTPARGSRGVPAARPVKSPRARSPRVPTPRGDTVVDALASEELMLRTQVHLRYGTRLDALLTAAGRHAELLARRAGANRRETALAGRRARIEMLRRWVARDRVAPRGQRAEAPAGPAGRTPKSLRRSGRGPVPAPWTPSARRVRPQPSPRRTPSPCPAPATRTR